MKKRKIRKNKGSAVIEMTLLMPIILGCIYLYIMLFLFYIQSGNRMDAAAESLYKTDEDTGRKGNPDSMVIRSEGKVKIVQVKEQGTLFDLCFELRKDNNNPVENIRRWQLAADTVQ